MENQPSKEMLHQLYWIEKLSVRKIGAKLGLAHFKITQLMDKFKINRRKRIEAVVAGTTKYYKKPFSGIQSEQAYLLGLAYADLRRRRHGYQIQVSLGTTHPAMSRLFKECFGGYSKIVEKPCFNKKTGRYGWVLDAYLHPSFEFLLWPKVIPSWITANRECLLSFIAGYFDGEGTLCIAKNSPRCVAFIFAIASEDREIIRAINTGLIAIGFHPSLRIGKKKGSQSSMGKITMTYSNDVWVTRMKRKGEIIKLISILPIRHPEKMEKKQLMIELKERQYIIETKEIWNGLQNGIKNDVDNYLTEARTALSAKERPCANSQALA